MELGLVSIQRNRGPWLIEWFAFHYLVGFRKFYFYAHLCTDGTEALLTRLARRFDVKAFMLDRVQDRIQLSAYQHACDNYMDEVDWMCFLDGDEFIFPTVGSTLPQALEEFEPLPISALGVYNRNFGSAGHIAEPPGLITENYRRRAAPGFRSERRVKSLVKGRQRVSTSNCSHVFATPGPTVDELMRPVSWGFMPDYEPSYSRFQLNHYVCQSRSYYLSFKQHSGHADASASAPREEAWWQCFDTNEVEDDSMLRFAAPLRALVEEIHAEFGLPPPPLPQRG